MPRPPIDLTGRVFDNWTVLKRVENRGVDVMWLCRCACECGTEKTVAGRNLRRGDSKNCGCKHGKLIDLAGQVFGDWTVIERVENNKHGHTVWRCQCSCGTEKPLRTSDLRRREVSTGCNDCVGDRLRMDVNGQVFGQLTAIEYVGRRNGAALWRCRCMCGEEKIVSLGCLRSGKTKSCGHWRGKGCITKFGYRIMRMPDHPNAGSQGYIFEHVAVMSEMLGRPLIDGENVHHRNGIRHDNRPDNLELWKVMQPSGQRIDDLIDYIARFHTEAVINRLAKLTVKDRYRSAADLVDLELAT